jgi:hypothetical protein
MLARLPPQLRRGGRDIKKKDGVATFDGADGVVLVKRDAGFPDQHHPVCAAEVASRHSYFAQPPLLS